MAFNPKLSPAEAVCSASGKSDGGLEEKERVGGEMWRPVPPQDSQWHYKQGSQFSYLGSVVPWQDGGPVHHLLTGGQNVGGYFYRLHFLLSREDLAASLTPCCHGARRR